MKERRPCEITTDDDQSRAPRSRDILRFAPVVPLTTAGGCCAVAACLWQVLPQDFLPAWLVVGLAIAVAQWQSLRWFGAGAAPVHGETNYRRWILASALASGSGGKCSPQRAATSIIRCQRSGERRMRRKAGTPFFVRYDAVA